MKNRTTIGFALVRLHIVRSSKRGKVARNPVLLERQVDKGQNPADHTGHFDQLNGSQITLFYLMRRRGVAEVDLSTAEWAGALLHRCRKNRLRARCDCTQRVTAGSNRQHRRGGSGSCGVGGGCGGSHAVVARCLSNTVGIIRAGDQIVVLCSIGDLEHGSGLKA